MAVSRFIKKRQEDYRKLYGKVEYEVMQITKDTFGGEVEKSTKMEDMKDHVDFWWDSPKKGRIGIDVKGIRKNDNGEYDDSIFWVEFRNNPGLPGWIYGKEEYIAIKTFKQIVYIKREVLKEYAEKKLGKKKPVNSKKVLYNDKIYDSANDCAKELGIPMVTVAYRCRKEIYGFKYEN